MIADIDASLESKLLELWGKRQLPEGHMFWKKMEKLAGGKVHLAKPEISLQYYNGKLIGELIKANVVDDAGSVYAEYRIFTQNKGFYIGCIQAVEIEPVTMKEARTYWFGCS